jgi:hypothetical protein
MKGLVETTRPELKMQLTEVENPAWHLDSRKATAACV